MANQIKGKKWHCALKKHHVYNFDMEIISNKFENPELLNCIDHDIEVISNIYENPDLLKENK